jgi:hypothetical protein
VALTNLDQRAITLGLVWLALGAAYLVWLTRGFPPHRPLDPLVVSDPWGRVVA